MHHGGGPPNAQRQLQRSKSVTGSEAEEAQQSQMQLAVTQQQVAVSHPQSSATSFAPAAAAPSPSAPQSPNYQTIIMSRTPVTGQNMNITLQNVSQVVTAAGSQQITLTPLPLQSPASPGFQHQAPQWRFEHGGSSYIQVTSPLPQPMQPQSPTQHSPVPRPGAPTQPTATLGVCGQSPTRFMEAGMVVRQINLGSPSGSGHFIYQEGTGLTQLAPTSAAQVQMASPGAPAGVRERRLSQPHSQTGGTIHHLGPQSPVAPGTALPTLASPGHITTSNLPPQISSIIQGQLARPMIFEKPSQGLVAGVGTPTAAFGVTPSLPPSSPSRSNAPQGLSSVSLTTAGPSISTVKKQTKKLEEIAPSSPEVAQLRKQCLEHHGKAMEKLKESFREYLIELFFLQQLQGNMMDYLAFKKKPCVPLFTYLRQNDLDLEEEEEEEEGQSEVINDEVKVVTGKDGQTGTPVAIAKQLPPNVSAAFSVQQQPFQVHQGPAGGAIASPVDIDAFKRQQALAQGDQAKRCRIEVGRHGMIFQHPAVAPLGSPGVPLQQLMPTAQGGMPPTPQTVQIAGQKPNQQQYDPSKGPPVQNAACLHTPPPQLPSRMPPVGLTLPGLPLALAQPPQQQMVVEQQQATLATAHLPGQVKMPGAQVTAVAGAVMAPLNPHTQLQAQLQQQMQSGLHIQIQAQNIQQPGPTTMALVRPAADSTHAPQRLISNSLHSSALSPAPLSASCSTPLSINQTPPRPSNVTPNATQSKLATPNGTVKMAVGGQISAGQSGLESTQDKQIEQAKLETQVHQRIAELRKVGQWSASRLPKLQEAQRPKSQWDYLLEEMQWMAADFAQERRWKIAAAKKLVRTCVRYHDEQRKIEEQAKKEAELHLRHIASAIAREVEFFWANIEQVVEIKLHYEISEKQQKMLRLQGSNSKGQCYFDDGTHLKTHFQLFIQLKLCTVSQLCTHFCVLFACVICSGEDEESTIEEQEALEIPGEQKAELAELNKEAEIPLETLLKQYAGAYAEGFEWPQSSSHSEDERDYSEEMETGLDRPHVPVLIDSLLSVDQYRGAEQTPSSASDGKPAKDIAEVAQATEQILPKGAAKTTSTFSGQPPSLLHGSLRGYQQVGVDWLTSLYRKHLNGILADETGLGKTVQTVAYLAHLACQEGIWGPHLVVVRTCKLLSWEVEFKRWCPGLKNLLYLGSKRERRSKRTWWSQPNSFHVCLTSYKLLLKDQAHFLKRHWSHLILDEVQLVKNLTEKQWDTILSMKSQQRVMLINSPLQNTLQELWTTIHFLLPGITRPFLDFPVKVGTEQNQDYCHKLVIRLHRMIQPFILRRSKRDVEKQLPKKYEHILKCRLSARQKRLYDDVLSQPSAQEALKSGHFVSIMRVLIQLQRVCNHPELLQRRDSYSTYVCPALQYHTPSLLMTTLQQDHSNMIDLSLFDLIGNETRLSRYESDELLPKLKVTRQLVEEIQSCPDPPPRPKTCKIKPMRLFQPVQYGTKPEGRLVPISAPAQQQRCASTTTLTTPTTTATTTATTPMAATAQNTQPKGKPVFATAPSTQGGDAVKIAQLASIAGTQNRVAQPETPVTLQFQGNKFTLSPSQLRQLTTGQPLQLQGTLGNILQIVSAPGQPLLRPQGSVVMQAVPQPVPIANSAGTPGTPPPTQSTTVTPNPTAPAVPQESNEEHSRQLRERHSRLLAANERRCSRSVLYGHDLIKMCLLSDTRTHRYHHTHTPTLPHWRWVGHENCEKAHKACVSTVPTLKSMLFSAAERQDEAYMCTFKGESFYLRFSSVVPAAVAPPPELYASKPPLLYRLDQKSFRQRFQEAVAPHTREIRAVATPPLVCFPDPSMLEVDSGKLEALSVLLYKLRSESRRVLIFTEMMSMLDILEAFLDYRHMTYLRVDESLTVEERQEQVRRFNRNQQVFCTILTNRCCSAVGHVFDADTIVFYDTDLNPCMDARTQEWCDKIGRSKDIHIYSLESANSIEEKLLKNGTKDLIREVAAQGADYSLAFLTQRTIQELFEVEVGSGEKVEEFVVLHQDPSPSEAISPRVARPYVQALQSITRELHADKEQQWDKEMGPAKEEELVVAAGEESSQMEELNAVMNQLTPIEAYAMQYLEYLHAQEDKESAKERLDSAKRSWELQQHKKLKAEYEERKMMDDEEELFTYTRDDAYNMEYVFESEDGQTEIMPLWTPPTPPQDDNDIYIDSVICLMYDTSPMVESKLPPIYSRKENKRLKMDPSASGRKKKKVHGESVVPPRSLFDKASLLKVRRDGKDQRKSFSLKQQAPFAKPLPSLVKPAMEVGQDNPEWLISEDWALLQAVKQLLELPLNLTIVSPAHTPNWDLVSDVVNSCSRIYRSPKQCRNRYENVIIPREEGKLIYEANPKKKTKSIYKSKNSRPLRTCQIYTQDDNATQIQLYSSRFELMKIIASKRSPPIKPQLGLNPFQKNPKHASVLAESGISYDKPLPPIQVASQRAERIAKEKKALAEQQRAQQLAQQQQPGAPQAQTGPAQTQTQAQAAGQPPSTGVSQATVVPGAAAVTNAAVLVSSTVGGNVIVNTVAGVPAGQFQANKRLASPVLPGAVPVTPGAPVVHAQQRTVSVPTPPTEVGGHVVRAVTPVTAAAVVSTTLTQVQSQPRSLVPSAGMQLSQGKQHTPAHLILRQQQQQLQQQQTQATSLQMKAVGKPQQAELLKLQKQKLQLVQQQQVAAAVAAAQGAQPGATQPPAQVQPASSVQASPQLATVSTPRPGAVQTGTMVANLQVARLTRVPAPAQITTQPGQTAQVALTKPVVSVPAVVSSAGVTTLPVSVAIGQAQKTGGQVVTHPFQVQQVQQLLQRQKQATGQQKTAQTQQTQATVQQKSAQSPASQQQKVTYTAATTLQQPTIKTQYFTTSLTPPQKSAAGQQIQVAKLPQIVQQPAVANIQQLVSSPPQVRNHSHQQVVTATQATATVSPQMQTPPPHSPAQQSTPAAPTAEVPPQQPSPQTLTQGKPQARSGTTMRSKTPAKPSGGS
uniref:E1A binding protein p400 n=1 Tax=Denticeps clupeoides TaxID=299321 RepID=A0AAY4AVB0_9TELE